ncbi:hypothetical protein TrispH2_006386 [Trichoplax sp. H2]|nr:hypothetical protein TrispH2_006386 [Trichoplax sp. H2]|eukprot:RDD41550.1 hypothetical protein TrispH2_006386 [Trichoplax sp. H2]
MLTENDEQTPIGEKHGELKDDDSPITLFLQKLSSKLPQKSSVFDRVREVIDQKEPYYEPWPEDKMKMCFLIRNKKLLPGGTKDRKFFTQYLGPNFCFNQMYKSWEVTKGYDSWRDRNLEYEGDDLGLSQEHLLDFKSALRQEYLNNYNSSRLSSISVTTETESTSSTEFVPPLNEVEETTLARASTRRNNSSQAQSRAAKRSRIESSGVHQKETTSTAGFNQFDRIKAKSKKLVTVPMERV